MAASGLRWRFFCSSKQDFSRAGLRPRILRVTSGACLKRGASGSPVPPAEAHSGHRGLRSLEACFAHGSWLRSHPTPALGARATPRFSAGRCASRRRCVAVSRAPDRPPGWRRFDERAEPAQAKTGRMLSVEPVALPTGGPDGGASMSGRSPPKRKRSGCFEWSPYRYRPAARTAAPNAGGRSPPKRKRSG